MYSRIVSSALREEDLSCAQSLRPKNLEEYFGQKRIKKNLKIFIQSAQERGETLDHVLLCGPPGLGKTTLANIIANELKTGFKSTSGPAIERPIDLLVVLKNLENKEVFFIDEIHRLNRLIEEILYPAMEDFCFDRIIGKGVNFRTAKIPLPYYTLIGATTRAGLLSSPLRNRFGIVFHLDFYEIDDLKLIIERSSNILGIKVTPQGALEIAKRSRGTPRIANRLLRRIRDFAQVESKNLIDLEIAQKALDALGIDQAGLDELDRRILEFIVYKFKGGPVGIESLAACINEDSNNLEEIYEPYLLQMGFIDKTPRGRVAGPKVYEHFNIKPLK
ncbi:MAG: Holliday junction branch migration DNA helicase RuvB [Armatimonadetes bacterium]|nr:Holliday junction branch migration DNA helicase RuvB [Armatimonadota bacterium]